MAAAAPAPAPVTAEKPAPAPAPTPAPAPAPPPPAADADPAQSCMQIGIRVAGLLIANATDPVLRAQYEQARADTVRSTAEACMRGKWDAEVRQCFLTASTLPAIDACKTRAPGPATNKPTRGS